jgi:hypothetical protein
VELNKLLLRKQQKHLAINNQKVLIISTFYMPDLMEAARGNPAVFDTVDFLS